MRLCQFLNVLPLLLAALCKLLHLLALDKQLVLKGSVLGWVNTGLGFLVHEHLTQAHHLIRERLELHFKFLQLGKLKCTL